LSLLDWILLFLVGNTQEGRDRARGGIVQYGLESIDFQCQIPHATHVSRRFFATAIIIGMTHVEQFFVVVFLKIATFISSQSSIRPPLQTRKTFLSILEQPRIVGAQSDHKRILG
jgi:hypothetical protein